MKQSFAYWALRGVTPADYSQILAMGVTGVELAPREKWDELCDAGFTLVSFGGHKSLEDGLNKRSNHSRIADEIAQNCELARQYEIPNLIVFPGNRNGLSDEEGAEITIEGLHLVKKTAEDAGVTLVMELLNSKVDHPDYQCDHTAWGVKVVEAVNSPRVKLLYDIYHMQIMEGDLIRTIRENIAHIGHFHTAGNPGRHDLDENQEIFHPPIARAIKELDYSGWIGHEFIPTKAPLEALREAAQQFAV